jgi:hypothetical protein
MTALARASIYCRRQTRPFVRESAPHQETRNCLTVLKIWSWTPHGYFIPRQTGLLTVGRHKTQLSSAQLSSACNWRTNTIEVNTFWWTHILVTFRKHWLIQWTKCEECHKNDMGMVALKTVGKKHESQRKFRVSVEGELSTQKDIQAEVPQSSILSPTLYSLYTNHTTQTPRVYLGLFADDIYIYIYIYIYTYRQSAKRVIFSESCSEVSVLLRRRVNAGT